jgi:hypothetical protein
VGGVLYAKSDLFVGGEQIEAGDQFVVAVGSDGDSFHRGIVRISARAVAQLLDKDARFVDADFKRRNREAEEEAKASRHQAPGESDLGGFDIGIDISL